MPYASIGWPKLNAKSLPVKMTPLVFASLLLAFLGTILVSARPADAAPTVDIDVQTHAPPNCFPAIGFNMPKKTPTSLTNWWCSHDTEYAFVGFSYEITDCKYLAVYELGHVIDRVF